ncbi:MAG TPA: OmpA family protein [Salinimicrobium sp.]|nr:OmpA family protein [Salinimicrobium sp.]
MKHLSRFLLASLFVLCFSTMSAQDENNPWAIGIGINAVDYYPNGDDNGVLGSRFDEFFNAKDHWNILPSLSRISVARYFGGGFHFEAAASANQIEKYGDARVENLSYYALDGMFNYSFRSLIDADGWIDPMLGIGGGLNWIDAQNSSETLGAMTLNGMAGFNFWLSENVALTLQSTYKHAFDENRDSHLQHAGGIKFSFGGKDTDGDGIYDKDDECPETPGLEEFNGCPDTDSDGIRDSEDDCPNEAGLPEFNGCPDTDSDGVPDNKDECPTEAGLEELNGCPDADEDGIRDSEDECPNEAGPEENNGCPWEDTDEDGVLDKDDRCPDVAGTVENDGCPEVTIEIINELNEYSRTILFDLNKSTIRSESNETLKAIADIMEEYPNTIFHIEGHTDSQGSDSYNEKLSRERAASVKTFLQKEGIPANRLTSEGYGEKEPIASNSTAAGRQQNRRVEISLDKDKEMKE